VWPFPQEAAICLERATKLVAVEGNATGQFANLVRKETGIKIKHRVLHYSGLQMSVEWVAQRLKEIL